MKLVIFGLSVSSSWGNGHATIWRGLCRALAERGHTVVFFERDTPYYADHRDLTELPGAGLLYIYSEWDDVLTKAKNHLSDADVAMVTSYCPDGVAASELVLESPVEIRTFYDLDTPITLSRLQRGLPVDYIGPRGLFDFDLVLSYTGGIALSELRSRLGARRVAALYGSVDPLIHHPVCSVPIYQADLSYLGTYAEDRQAALDTLFIESSRRMPNKRFIIGGSLYPQDFPWTENIRFVRHMPPPEHPAFYCSSPLTLNVTRHAMAEMGYCPSGRLFEASACGTAIISDMWEGIDRFFEPSIEILIAHSSDEVVDALSLTDEELTRVALAARERTLSDHTAERRVEDLEAILETSEQRTVNSER